jgi:hypothetical protein
VLPTEHGLATEEDGVNAFQADKLVILVEKCGFALRRRGKAPVKLCPGRERAVFLAYS